jgi:hypothetical protein
MPLQPYMLAWLSLQVTSHLQFTHADWAPAPAFTCSSPAMCAKALAATPITATDCGCCLMYALGVHIYIQTEFLPRYYLILDKRAARGSMQLAKAEHSCLDGAHAQR